MYIEEISSLTQLEKYKDEWCRLQRQSELQHPFVHWDWLVPWAEYLQTEKKYPLILLVKNNLNDVIGIAPLQICRDGFFTYIEAFAQEFADYTDWLCNRNHVEDVSRMTCNWIIAKKRHYDFIRIRNIVKHGNIYNSLNAFFPRKLLPTSIAPHIEIVGQFESFQKKLNSKFLSDTRRRKRKLEKEIGNLEYFVVEDESQIPPLIDLIKQWLHDRRNAKRGTSYLDRPGMVRFITNHYARLFELGMLHLSGLIVKDHIAALNVAFKYDKSLFSYTPVCRPDLYKYSLIRLLKLYHIEQCYELGVKRYDFCLGGEEYKFQFNPKIKQLYGFEYYGRTCFGFGRMIVDTLIKPKLKKLVSKYRKFINGRSHDAKK